NRRRSKLCSRTTPYKSAPPAQLSRHNGQFPRRPSGRFPAATKPPDCCPAQESQEGSLMEFAFSDEQEMIRESAESFLADVSDSAAVRAAMASELGHDPELWRRVCGEMVWPAIHIPEEYGGLGL